MLRRACCPSYLSCVAPCAAMQERHESPAPTTLAQAQQQAADMQSLAALQQLAQNGAGPLAFGCWCSSVFFPIAPALRTDEGSHCADTRQRSVIAQALTRSHKLRATHWGPHMEGTSACCLFSGALARAASATPPPHSHTPPLPPHTPPVQGASPGAPPGHAQALAANAAAMAAAAASGMGLPPAGMHPGGGGMNGGVVNTLEYQAAYQARPRSAAGALSSVRACCRACEWRQVCNATCSSSFSAGWRVSRVLRWLIAEVEGHAGGYT